MAIKFIKNSPDLKDKTVFLRLDFNEEVEKKKLMDDFRIQSILPTVQLLLEQNCRLVIGSHMGRPDGKPDKKLTLEPAARDLARLLGKQFVAVDSDFSPNLPAGLASTVVLFRGDITEHANREKIKAAASANIIVLENLRFYPGEEDNGVLFAEQLAELADVYVNDAFAVCHRKAASVVGITEHLPSYGGLLLQKEITALNRVMTKPASPFVLIMGGIKISDKEKTLVHLGRMADKILLGGGLANLLLKVQGYEIGLSKSEDSPESRRVAESILRNFKDKLVLPKDVVVSKSLDDKSSIRAVPAYQVHSDDIIFDVGPETILEFAGYIKNARTIVWNGPLGHFEVRPFHTGTMALARVFGGVAQRKCFGVVGGGETVTAIHEAGQVGHVDHVSTGGGAMLEYLAGEELPALKALS
jgi:phosphoglycerate kinase